ncbi:Mu transposase C-terminal domain-containing protein [Agrobacterium vaccinii]|uniref:Mu transposase C-terminal domain-containing protein n=1 Tax=Agrobacterium vaccinii TaxID=2735528 RepID=UPI001E43E627|nr:Mu transposase C-terminal domain-containing protein [Agrobacterium vaccinii]UHS61335.1 Mu transposase C-terminal domain-containing protein [Agrobacterium vaccinii]
MLDLMTPATGSSLLPIKTTSRLTEFDKIIINGVEYMWDKDVADERIFIMAEGNGRARKIDCTTVEAMIEIGDMVVIEGYYYARAVERRALVGHDSVLAMQDHKLNEAIRKLKWVQLAMRAKSERKYGKLADAEDLPFRILRDYQKSIAAAMKRDGGKLQETNSKNSKGQSLLLGAAPPLRTLNHWIAQYKAADYDISGLIDHRHGDHTSPFTDEERNLHTRFALKYASRTKPTVPHLHRRMVATFIRLNRSRVLEGLPKLRPIGETSFRKKINKLPEFYKMSGREGRKKARLYFQIVRGGIDKGIPGQRGETDEWTVELKTILEDTGVWNDLLPEERRALQTVRLFFSGVIDVATKCIVAFRVFVNAPNTDSALTTLELTTRDKTFLAKAAGCRSPWEMKCKFHSIGLDNASWNKSDAVRGTLLDAGVREVFPPAREPYLRGTIERFFRTLAFLGLQDFTGRTFSNVVKKGDYDPDQDASIRTDQLALIFIRLIVDVYHNIPHSGLWGATPRQAWLELTRGRKLSPPPTGSLRRNIYGTHAIRSITKQGIVFEDIQFQSEEIQQIRRDDPSMQVHIRVDRYDLSEISVIWKNGFLRVPATLKGLKGVSYWQWMKAKERLRLHDRQDYDLRADVIADALEWAAEQSDVAIAQLELDAPPLKFDEYEYEDARMARFIRATDTGSELAGKVRAQASLRPELAGIFGSSAPKAVLADEVKAQRSAEEIAELRAAEARKTARRAPSEDDEFGIID